MSLPGIDKVGVSQFPPFSGQPNYVQRNRLGAAQAESQLNITNLTIPAGGTLTFGAASGGLAAANIAGDLIPDLDNARLIGSVVAPVRRWADINGVSMQSSGTSLDNMVVTSVGSLSIGSTITTGVHNTVLNTSQLNVTTGNDNVIIGDQALRNVTTGSNNIAIGASALFTQVAISNNIAIGSSALRLTTVTTNMAIGITAGENVTTGLNNTYIGNVSGHPNQTGSDNTCVGLQALGGNVVGTNNVSNCTAVGSLALAALTTGAGNTAIGKNTGLAITTGAENTMLGNAAGNTITTGARNTLLGSGAQVGTATHNDCVVIGFGAVTDASSQFVLGSAGNPLGVQTTVGAAGAASNTPAAPQTYLRCKLNGTVLVIPAYLAA
ncbi:MAG TPA: hypothetical protein VFC02_09735 [Anaerolineales bacterium]|nr:hypothetical protein [Anaerolineales bacterium]